MTIRARLANSQWTFRLVSKLLSGWIRLVMMTSHVEKRGWDSVRDTVGDDGAALLVCWHQRLICSPYIFPDMEARCCSLTSHKRPGRIVGAIHRRFGITSLPMDEGLRGAANMRQLLRGLSNGVSICVAPDGSSGPARVCKVTPIQWARSAQVPIFTFTFSCKRFWAWPTWDRLMFPMPFNRITMEWRRWDIEVPRNLTADMTAELQSQLEDFMNEVAAEADARVGLAEPFL